MACNIARRFLSGNPPLLAMSYADAEPRRWALRRWWVLVGVIFTVQLGLIFWLGDNSPIRPRTAASPPILRLAGSSGELLELADPTLFALPHRRGFSGAAWMKLWRPQFQPFQWSEPPRWLTLAVPELGGVFQQFMMTNNFEARPWIANPEPALRVTELAAAAVLPLSSSFRLEGGLAGRSLLTTFKLPAWPHTDVLTNTVVAVLVDAQGVPASGTLLTGSGSKEADQHALRQVKEARFEALTTGPNSPATGLSWGKIIFEWNTLPLPPTNAPAAAPSP
jgi:hypothetical protein